MQENLDLYTHIKQYYGWLEYIVVWVFVNQYYEGVEFMQ